ncbi:unnamed protein product [Chrysodeixis includens]|uniref:Uncharacterized protein n=1 Tax=Chrysodeixis includens TaxID=689277 RepID=A0A9P0BPY6_CHRIL|nr:unnamed protein product [Chrysodeixis includens]
MQGKYFFLVLMITYSQHIASSHILTSSYMDMSLPSCMRLLTYRVINDLCPTYAYVDYSSEEFNGPPMIPREMAERKLQRREVVLKSCCTKPCTLTELLTLC